MKDQLPWMLSALRLLIGVPLFATGYMLVGTGSEFLGFIVSVAGLIVAVPGSFPLVITLVYLMVAVPLFIWAMWQVDQFIYQTDIAFAEWGLRELRRLPFFLIAGAFWWFWRSGDPFKDRKL